MKHSKFLHLFSPVLVLSILLTLVSAACGAVVAKPPVVPSATVFVPDPTSTSPPTETHIPTETTVPTDTATPFVPKATVKIFSLSPLTGEFAASGTDIMRAAELAVKQLAEPLMELGYKVELVPYDDQSDVMASVAVSKDIVADPEILCGVGPFTSRSVNQVKEIFHQAKLGFISPSATAAFVTDSGYPEVNRVVGRNDGEGDAAAQFAKAQGFLRLFTIYQSGKYPEFNAYHFREEANRLGLEVVGNMKTDAKKDFGKIIERIQAANADLVYFSTLDVEQAGNFFREARAAGYTGSFLGNEGIASPALLEFAGPLLLDGNGTYYTAVLASAIRYPGAANFIEDFETLYGSGPQIFAAQAYDTAGICMRAMEEASRAKGGEIPTREEVASAIRALQDYNGITGVYNFNEYGDPDPAQYFVFQAASSDPAAWDQNPLIASFEIAPPE